MTLKKSSLSRQECIQHSYERKNLFQTLTFTFLLFFLSLFTHANCQTINKYNQNYISTSQQPRYQSVSNDGLYFVASYQNITDHLKVFKNEQSAFSQVANINLINTRIRSIKISNQGQKIVYVDQNSYRVKIHQKKLDGSFSNFADQQIHFTQGPNYVDISADATFMAVVGNDALAKIYKSNGKFSQFVLFQTIDVINQLVDEAITSTSKFLACSFSKNLQSFVLSGQTGEIYLYQLVGTSYVLFQKIPNSAGGSNHLTTFALQLNSDSTTMIAGTSENFLSFQRSGKSQYFLSPTIYQNCFSYNSSAYVVALTDDGDRFYVSCYYRSPTHVFQRPKNSKSVFTLSQTIPTIDVFSISLSGEGAYLLIGDSEATYFKIFQYFCGNGSYFSLDGNCQACNKIKCNKCSRFSSEKCFQCQENQTLIGNSCQNCQDCPTSPPPIQPSILLVAILVPLSVVIIIFVVVAAFLIHKYCYLPIHQQEKPQIIPVNIMQRQQNQKENWLSGIFNEIKPNKNQLDKNSQMNLQKQGYQDNQISIISTKITSNKYQQGKKSQTTSKQIKSNKNNWFSNTMNPESQQDNKSSIRHQNRNKIKSRTVEIQNL